MLKENGTEVSSGVYDVIGIGIGPFNLGLAALLDGTSELDALFLEQKEQFSWHEGMLVDGATLQVPFMADLVTMIDPTSPFSYLNYLKEQGRLYSFYFFEQFHIPRKEYNHYCQWAAGKLPSCKFGMTVTSVSLIQGDGASVYEVTVEEAGSGTTVRYLAKELVLGVGTVPQVRDDLRSGLSETMFHSSSYMKRSGGCKEASSITVVGSGQSAAEIFYDLLKSQPERGYELTWITRSRGFFPMEYSKLGLEHFSPDYTSYFYSLPPEKKDGVLEEQHLLYKGISAATIAQIYDELYHQTACGGQPRVNLLSLAEVKEITLVEGGSRLAGEEVEGGGSEERSAKERSAKESSTNAGSGKRFELSCLQWEQEKGFRHESEVVILATGYKHKVPGFVDGIRHLVHWDGHGRYEVNADYSLRMNGEAGTKNRIYVQNGELHTHGVGAPDLGLGAHRNAVILNGLLKEERYPVRERNVFQRFGAP
ncbi:MULTISPECIES: lysine N(6)-hydroxylase/L-ornithine N(5)-oxygenase family protein [unclassified Paenibacillus]|uniref:lysine N(6)-hydroxylase/L-ornithine N(5)-oxygenase family protein n=1 Tax=unclassified Paenibacillus TaxID=185978 RepID=UPI0036D2B5A7